MPYIDAKPDLEYLAHFGVKGMKWGVRKQREGGSRKERREAKRKAKQLKDAQRSYDRVAKKYRNVIDINVASRMNGPKGYISKLNKKYSKWDFTLKDSDPMVSAAYNRYQNEFDSKYVEMFAEELVSMFGERPK